MLVGNRCVSETSYEFYGEDVRYCSLQYIWSEFNTYTDCCADLGMCTGYTKQYSCGSFNGSLLSSCTPGTVETVTCHATCVWRGDYNAVCN